MNPSGVAAELARQKQRLEAAHARKGQRATNKASRAELESHFGSQGRIGSQQKGHTVRRTTQINYAYPRSIAPLASLKPITISELRLETRHKGKVLIVRTFVQPIRIQSVQSGIEDQNLDVDQVAVYNTDPDTSPTQTLPKAAIFAIKEPYYKAAAAGGYIVRVDHPSDIIKLEPTNDIIPLALAPRLIELDRDASRFKDDGNAAFKQQRYASAVEDYTRGLTACCEDDTTMKHDLHRNRSLANFYLHRYEPARDDALAALYTCADTDVKKPNENVKALYRAGRALYCLEDFSKAKTHFEDLLQISPDDKDGQDQLRRTALRIVEAAEGSYDFAKIKSSARLSNKCLDHASFTTGVEVRAAGEKGRGLFATRDIKAGELVLAEKAFSIAFESETGSDFYVILNINTNTGSTGPSAMLYYRLIQKMLHNPEQAKRFLQLHDGGYSPKCTAKLVDGATSIDTFQVAAIMEHNAFGCANTRSSDDVGVKSFGTEGRSVGVWILASYMNHACVANSHRSFIGDFMIVRATKDIPKGQEIFIPYRLPEMDYVATQKALKNWKFACACRMCAAEATTTTADRKQRQTLVKELTVFLENHKDASRYVSNQAVITRAKKLYDKLDATYDKTAFAGVPRMPLIRLGNWMCAVYQHEKTIHKVIDTAQSVLRDCGFTLHMKGHSLEIGTANCYSEGDEIDAAMYTAHACFSLGDFKMGEQYKAFAKERYLIVNGEMRGFERRYGE